MATRLEIVTPKGRVFADDVDVVVFPDRRVSWACSRSMFPW